MCLDGVHKKKNELEGFEWVMRGGPIGSLRTSERVECIFLKKNLGWNFVKFWPENYDFDLYKGFSMRKKKAQIHQISKKEISRLPYLYDKFQ